MSDGQHQHPHLFILIPDGGYNCAGPVLAAFFLSSFKLGMPEIAVADDQTGEGLWKSHCRLLQFAVEMRIFIGDLGVTNSIRPLLWQFAGETCPAITPQEAMPFLNLHDHQGIAPMLGDYDWLMPGLVAQRPEGLLEFT